MVRESTAASSRSSSMPSWVKVVQKGQPADALLKRLKTLRGELNKVNQDDLSERILDQIRSQLMHDDLLFHKHKEVRTTLAVCLAELLRLYAPECPFTDGELLKVFSFFLAVLTSSKGGLLNPATSQYAECVQLLSNLVTIRAFALLCDRGISDKPMLEYTKGFFDLIKPDTPKNVELLLCESLCVFVQYSNVVPDQFVEIIIANFHPKVKRNNPAAAHLAELIGNQIADDLQTSIAQYFNDVLTQAAQTVEEDERAANLHAAHVLISHMHKSAPLLLVNVVPQLDEEMRAEDARLRLLAVRTLGHIFADHALSAAPQQQSSIHRYAATWKSWLGRSWDKNSAVRVAWLEAIKELVSQEAADSSDLMKYVEQKFLDADEKVRLASINVLSSMDLTTLRKVPMDILETLSKRINDKKQTVRQAALDTLGRTFTLAYAQGQSVLSAYTWIPGAMAEALCHDDGKGMTVAVQSSFEKFILPLPKSVDSLQVDAWTERFLLVLETIDSDLFNVFLKLSNLQGPRTHFNGFLDACKRFNGGVVDAAQAEDIRLRLLHHIGLLAKHYVDPLKAGNDLNAFAQANDARTYKLFAAIIDPACSLERLIKAKMELSKRMETERYGATVIGLIHLTGFLFVNSSSIPSLLEALNEPKAQSSSELERRLFIVLKAISNERHEMLTSHVDLLKGHVHQQDESSSRAASLMALAKLQSAANEADLHKIDEDDIAQVKRIILDRGSSEESKWAAKILALAASDLSTSVYASAFQAAEETCQELASDLPLENSKKLVAILTALRQIVKFARETLGDASDKITKFIVEDVLKQPLPVQTKNEEQNAKTEQGDGQDWLEDEEMSSALAARLLSIRFLADRCTAYADSDDVDVIAVPVLRLLVTCMKQGEPAPGLCEGKAAAKARLRFEASSRILKLSRKSSCDKLIGVADFSLLSQTVQDEVWQVRSRFIRKLLKYAMRRSAHLPARFYVLGFMVAFDPEAENRLMVRTACSELMSVMTPERRIRYFDIGLARLIHLLNHHPDFENAVEKEGGFSIDSLKEVAQYFTFYLDCCATRENLLCLNHIAQRCKGMRDVFDEDRRALADDDGIATRGIHALSDLCICLIKGKGDSLGGVVGEWQGQIALPRDLYLPYANREEQTKIYKRSYLSDEAIEYFTQVNKRDRLGNAHSKKRKPMWNVEPATPSKRQSKQSAGKATKPKGSKKRKQKASDDVDEGVTSDETVSDEDDEDDEDGEKDSVKDAEQISEDESVESSEDEATAGRGVRTRRRLRQQKRLRNEGRRQRREALAKHL